VALYEVKRIAFKNPNPSKGGRSPVKREVACYQSMVQVADLRKVISSTDGSLRRRLQANLENIEGRADDQASYSRYIAGDKVIQTLR